MSCLSPRESAEFISKKAQDVKINSHVIPQVAQMISRSISEGEYDLSGWRKQPLHPKVADEAALQWIFLVDSLNFSFWTPEDAKYKVTFQGQSYTGYWALCAAINRALQEGVAVTSAPYLSSVTLEQVEHLFRSDDHVTIPLLHHRLRVMNQIGRTLLQEFSGSFVQCVVQSHGSASNLLQLVVDHFPSFRDTAKFKDCQVSFYKRGQILVGDIWACFGGQGLGAFHDIQSLTMFADYRVPQVLVYFGILEYSKSLLEQLSKEELLENGSRLEMEIRGCTIWSVELLCQELFRLGHTDLNAVLVDFYLWDFRRQNSQDLDSVPFHRTRCIYY